VAERRRPYPAAQRRIPGPAGRAAASPRPVRAHRTRSCSRTRPSRPHAGPGPRSVPGQDGRSGQDRPPRGPRAHRRARSRTVSAGRRV